MERVKNLKCRRSLFIICMLVVVMICGLLIIQEKYIPFNLKTEYKFNSGVTMEDVTHISTPAVYFPESIRKEGEFIIKNDTGYQICIATPQDGFLFLEQGEHRIMGKPLVFFIVQPKEELHCEGEFKIYESGGKIGFKYCIMGNQEEIGKMKFAAEIV